MIGINGLSKAYEATLIGDDGWIKRDPDETLEDFQAVVAAAEAWQAVKQINIVEVRQELCGGRAYISAIRFRRRR